MTEFQKDSFGLGFRLTTTYRKMDKELSTLMGIQWHSHPHKMLLEVVKCEKTPSMQKTKERIFF
jgi:hypothetical protein